MDISSYKQTKSHTSTLRHGKKKKRKKKEKGNLKRETETLQITVQNNAIRTNYVKAKIYKNQ